MTESGTDLIPAPSKSDHVRGSLDAPVVITEFADFQCPYCGDAFPVLERILRKYGARVAHVFRHFPLSMHPNALPAAEAAEAAAAAGKFWEMHDTLFKHQAALGDHDLTGYAAAIGLNAADVSNAVKNRTYLKRIERDIRSGRESTVPGTPALFINGYAYEDEVSFDALSDVIDRAVAAVSI